jgi:hypothetical protein
MGLLDKLKFWKHEEGFELGKYPGLESGPPVEGMMQEAPGMPARADASAGQPALLALPEERFGSMPPRMEGELGGMPGAEPADLGPAPPPPMMGIGRGQMSVSPLAPPASPVMQVSQAAVPNDLQVVNAKLDTLKALLDNITAKLDRLERTQQKEEVEVIPLQRRWR